MKVHQFHDALPKNPIIKSRERLRITPVVLAAKAGVTKQVIYDLQFGVSQTINQRVLDILKDPELPESYYAWQRIKRGALELPGDLLLESIDRESEIHPLQQIINSLKIDISQFAKEICLPRAYLYNYITGNQGGMSKILKNTLIECGLREYEVDELARLSLEYRNRKMAMRESSWKLQEQFPKASGI